MFFFPPIGIAYACLFMISQLLVITLYLVVGCPVPLLRLRWSGCFCLSLSPHGEQTASLIYLSSPTCCCLVDGQGCLVQVGTIACDPGDLVKVMILLLGIVQCAYF